MNGFPKALGLWWVKGKALALPCLFSLSPRQRALTEDAYLVPVAQPTQGERVALEAKAGDCHGTDRADFGDRSPAGGESRAMG